MGRKERFMITEILPILYLRLVRNVATPGYSGSGEMAKYNLRINGNTQTVDSSDADKPLLYILRELKSNGDEVRLRTWPMWGVYRFDRG